HLPGWSDLIQGCIAHWYTGFGSAAPAVAMRAARKRRMRKKVFMRNRWQVAGAARLRPLVRRRRAGASALPTTGRRKGRHAARGGHDEAVASNQPTTLPRLAGRAGR